MNLDAVIIVLREVLEASLLAGLLLALARYRRIGSLWLVPSVSIGLVGAYLYATNLGPVSEWWDYTGQEVMNASMQAAIFCAFLALSVQLRFRPKSKFRLTMAMATIVGLALVREASEILLYLKTYVDHPTQATPVMLGSAMGFVTGVCVGIVAYFLSLWAVTWRHAQPAILLALAVVVSGILVQSVSLLLQVDHLPHADALWDSSHLVDERSVAGQLLYAFIGYEATPNHWHALAWGTSLSLLVPLILWPSNMTGSHAD